MMVWKTEFPSNARHRGRFIVFEGIDGTGKSLQAKMLAKRIEDHGTSVLLTSEPSDGPVGHMLRTLVARPDAEEEARLFAEDRAYHLEKIILPALRESRVVICDRYVYSSVAYQGARGVDRRTIFALNGSFAIAPDAILLMEVPLNTALERINRGRVQGPSLFEYRENLERVSAIYSSLEDPLIRRIDGTGDPSEVHDRILNALLESLGHAPFLL